MTQHPELAGIARLERPAGGPRMTATGPILAAQVPRTRFDPYADAVTAAPVRFLYRLNPLAKLLAPVPAMVLLVFVRDAATPLAFLLAVVRGAARRA